MRGGEILYLFAQKAFRLPPRFGLDDGETGTDPFLPLGYFGEATDAGELRRRRGDAAPVGYAVTRQHDGTGL